MKVLVTGATGFLGQYIVEELIKHNYTVTAFGRNKEIGRQFLTKGISFLQGDFTNKETIRRACRGMDIVIHAGALSTVWGQWQEFYQTNVCGTENILQACEENQIKRLLFVSSPSIYASARNQFDIKEAEAPTTNDLNFYIKSKLQAEKRINENQRVNSTIIRPRGLFGVGDTSIIPRLISINQKIGIPLFNGGHQLVDVTCVENVALAIRLAIESDQAVGQTYNITNGEPMEFKHLLDQLHQAIGVPVKYIALNYTFMRLIAGSLERVYQLFQVKKEPLFTKYTLYLLNYSQTLSIEKAKKELGYQPKITVAEGIENYAKNYREN